MCIYVFPTYIYVVYVCIVYIFVLLRGPQKQATVPFGAASVCAYLYHAYHCATMPLIDPLSLPLGHAPTPPTDTVLPTLWLVSASRRVVYFSMDRKLFEALYEFEFDCKREKESERKREQRVIETAKHRQYLSQVSRRFAFYQLRLGRCSIICQRASSAFQSCSGPALSVAVSVTVSAAVQLYPYLYLLEHCVHIL